MNKNLLSITLTLLLSACGAGQSSDAYVQSARDYLGQGEVAEAEIELKNALRTDGDNTEARFLLGKIYFGKGELLAARKELMLASSAALTSEKVTPVLAKVYLGLADYQALMDLSGADLSPSAHATILAAKGLAELANGKLVNALEYTQQATLIAPDSSYARVAHARVLAAQDRGNGDRARAQLATVFERDEGNALAWELLGDIEMSKMNIDAAVSAYSEAIERGTDTVSLQFKRAITLINDGQFEAAQQDVDALIARHPKVLGVNYAQGMLHFKAGRLKESIANFDIALQNPNAWPKALFYAGTARMLLGNLEQAETLAEQYYTSSSASSAASLLLATIKIRKEDYSTAELLLEPVVDFSDNVRAKNLMILALAGQSKYDEAAQVATDVVGLQPESAAASAGAGASYYLSGDSVKTEEFLNRAIALDAGYLYPVKLLSKAYMDRGESERALAVIAAHIERNAESTEAFLLLARTEVQLQMYDKAQLSINQALALQPNHLGALQLLGDIAMAQQDYSGAEELFQKVLVIAPSNLETLLGLAKIAGIEQNFDKMEKWIERAIEAHPYKIEPRLVLARHYLVNGAAQKAILALSGLPDSTFATVPLLEAKARAYLRILDYKNAEYALHAALKQAPKVAELHFMMAQVRVGQTDYEPAIAALETALDLAPEHSAARILMAETYIAQRRLEAAGKQLQILRASVPQVLLHELEVDYALHTGDREGALRRAEAYFKDMNSTDAVITLARSQFLVGQKNRAVQHLLDWLKVHTTDVPTRVALAELYAAIEAKDDSLKQYQLALEIGGENLAVLNNLAWYLRDSDPKKALSYALRANALDSNSAELMDTLVYLYINTGDLANARETLAKAMAISPDNRSLLYRKAQLSHAKGNVAEAKDQLAELLADANIFRLRAEAEALYAELSQPRG